MTELYRWHHTDGNYWQSNSLREVGFVHTVDGSGLPVCQKVQVSLSSLLMASVHCASCINSSWQESHQQQSASVTP